MSFGFPFPLFIVDGESFATQMEDMTHGTFRKPENAFGPEDIVGKLVVEKILKLTNIEGLVALEGDRGKPVLF